MIAPLRPPLATTSEKSRPLHEAHQVVAASLLAPLPSPQVEAPPVPAWRAWIFVVWIVGVVSVYAAAMVGWI